MVMWESSIEIDGYKWVIGDTYVYMDRNPHKTDTQRHAYIIIFTGVY